jgi:hypothetical protein
VSRAVVFTALLLAAFQHPVPQHKALISARIDCRIVSGSLAGLP